VGKRVELRAEAFNLLNSVYFAAPNTVVDTAAGGRVTSTSNQARQIQLGGEVHLLTCTTRVFMRREVTCTISQCRPGRVVWQFRSDFVDAFKSFTLDFVTMTFSVET